MVEIGKKMKYIIRAEYFVNRRTKKMVSGEVDKEIEEDVLSSCDEPKTKKKF